MIIFVCRAKTFNGLWLYIFKTNKLVVLEDDIAKKRLMMMSKCPIHAQNTQKFIVVGIIVYTRTLRRSYFKGSSIFFFLLCLWQCVSAGPGGDQMLVKEGYLNKIYM